MAHDFVRRGGSLLLALVFLVTTVGFTALLYWQTKDDSSSDSSQLDLEEALNQQNNQSTGENMLEGTQLADFTPITTPITELQSIDLIEGTGEVVNPGATVTAHYTGAYVSTGEIFQSSHDSGQAIPFSLDGVIAGWTQGVPGMKVGGKRRLIIPGNLAYGEAPEGYAPGSTARPMGPLVFDIELVAVSQ